jgi:hypothetical protein
MMIDAWGLHAAELRTGEATAVNKPFVVRPDILTQAPAVRRAVNGPAGQPVMVALALVE